MVCWDPFFVVALGACRHRRSISSQSFGRFPSVDLLVATSCLFGFLAPAPRTLLREIGSNPDAVEEIQDTTGAGEHEEVEEYTSCNVSRAQAN